jgi:hypothetical protein
MIDLFVSDSTSIISYYGIIFDEDSRISNKSIKILDKVFDIYADVKMSILLIDYRTLCITYL